MKPFKNSLAFYRTRHRTPGCKLTHMFGIPLLALVPLTFFVNRGLSAQCLLGGVALQLLGHYVFEKNKPTFIETHDLMSVPASLYFVGEEWIDVATGQWLAKNGVGLWKKLPIAPEVEAEAHADTASIPV